MVSDKDKLYNLYIAQPIILGHIKTSYSKNQKLQEQKLQFDEFRYAKYPMLVLDKRQQTKDDK